MWSILYLKINNMYSQLMKICFNLKTIIFNDKIIDKTLNKEYTSIIINNILLKLL